MNRKVTLGVCFAVILVSIAFSIYFYPHMPEQMASHWDFQGEVNGYMPKFWGLFLMPIISAVMLGLFILLPKIDPLRRNVKKFMNYYNAFIIVLIVFFAYIHAVSILLNFGLEMNMSYLMIPAMAFLFWFIGVLLGKAKRNWFIGIKTPWTLSSDTVWNKTHELGATLFKICAGLFLSGLFFPQWIIYIVLVPIICIVVFLFFYSYYLYKKK